MAVYLASFNDAATDKPAQEALAAKLESRDQHRGSSPPQPRRAALSGRLRGLPRGRRPAAVRQPAVAGAEQQSAQRRAGQSDPGDPARHRRARVERPRLHAGLQGQPDRRPGRRARHLPPAAIRPGQARLDRYRGRRCGRIRQRNRALSCHAAGQNATGWAAPGTARVPAMAVTDIATRTYNHGWRLDPIVRSLLDTDFYKLLMLQMIREFYPDQQVTFSVINRSRHVRLAEVIDEGELRAQLDHARTIRFSKKELIWLAGNTFYGKTQMFSPDFINWLADFPPARIRAAQGRRPVRAAFPRAVDPHHDVGDPGARHPQRAALAPGDEGPGPLRARRALCPRQGQAVGQGRAAAQAGRPAAVGFRHAAAPRLSVAALVRRGGQGRPRPVLHRHLERAAGDGQRSRSDRHQRA